MENNFQNIINRTLPDDSSKKAIRKLIDKNTQPYRELMAYYKCALMEIETKFNVLNEELSLQYDRNPIETIKSRIKSTESILEKMERKGIFPTVESIESTLNDIAGIRVVCSYTSDIYMLADALLAQDDIALIEKKDYIKIPKENGYRSLHLIVETPIFLHDRKKMMKVEVQLRTLSMDWWASLEHKIKYKKDIPKDVTDNLTVKLKECAKTAAALDKKMEQIQKEADQYLDDKKFEF